MITKEIVIITTTPTLNSERKFLTGSYSVKSKNRKHAS